VSNNPTDAIDPNGLWELPGFIQRRIDRDVNDLREMVRREWEMPWQERLVRYSYPPISSVAVDLAQRFGTYPDAASSIGAHYRDLGTHLWQGNSWDALNSEMSYGGGFWSRTDLLKGYPFAGQMLYWFQPELECHSMRLNPIEALRGLSAQPLIDDGVTLALIVGTVPTAFRASAPRGLTGRLGLSYELKHLNKHLPGTPESLRLIQKEGAAHVFNNKATLSAVERSIMEAGRHTGTVRGWERYGLRFDKPIGYRIDAAGNRVPLHYGELKLHPKTGRYHVTPRKGPAS
jgi:hypothetical protein